MDDKKLFIGAGGGSKPTTTEDNLKSEDIVEFALAVSEGPIRGLAEGAKSFMVGDTPLISASGTRNFEKFAIGVHPGYPEGSARALDLKLGGATSTNTVNVNLLQNVPVTRQTGGNLRGTIDQLEVRIMFARLLKQEDNGSTLNNTAKFRLEYKAGSDTIWNGFFTEGFTYWDEENDDYIVIPPQPSGELSVTGKTTTGYVKEFRVDVPRLINDDWSIRVTKISPDDDDNDVVDIQWESFQTTNREKLTYPDTAIVHGLGVANGQFSSIPEFSGIYDGLIIRVPTNYNPDARTYDDSVPWDGSFKFAWTNNPAWVLYDLIVNTRYGLARHRRYVDANRFVFYEAARWCDTPVQVGDTNVTRPRYTFNDVILESRPAMEMLSYVAGSFNGLIYDDLQGQIHLRIDKDDPAVQIFTPENVTAEGFSYTFTDLTTRCNDVSVAFINPELDWAEDRRRITNITTNEEHIEKYGRIPLDFIAVGCTNVHEAVAKAQVRLISALTETTMVSFQTARQGALLSLYDVILIADPTMGWSLSGRMTTYDEQYVNFRDAIYIETLKTYTMKVQTQTGIIDVDVEPEQIGHVNRLRLVGDVLPENLPQHTVFTIEEIGGFGLGKPFRVLSISEVEGSPYVYAITATEINRNKYVLSEQATPIDEPKYNYQQPYLPGTPRNFTAVSGDDHLLVMPSGEVVSRILCTWRAPFGNIVKSYELQFKLIGDEAWQSLGVVGLEQYISPAFPGATYSLRVAALDPDNKRSAWAEIKTFLVVGKNKVPANVLSFSAVGGVFQIKLDWIYSAAKDIKKAEIWSSSTNLLASALKLAEISYPTNTWTHLGLGVDKTFYYWIRIQDSSGNFSTFSSVRYATTSKDAKDILDILEGQITPTQLAGDLNTRIDLIDSGDPNSILGKLYQEIQDRVNAILAEEQARIAAITNEALNRTNALQNEAQQRATGLLNEAQARGAQITQVNSRIQTAETSMSQMNTTLTAAVGQNASAIQQEAQTRVTADQAITNTANLLASRVGTAESSILTEAQTRASADSALTSSISVMNSRVGAAESAITNEAITRASQDSAITSSMSVLTSRVGSSESAIITEAITRANADGTLTTDLSALTTRVGTTEGSISALNTLSASSSSVTARTVTSLTVSVSNASASIDQLNNVSASSGSANAQQLNSLKAQVNHSTTGLPAATANINAINDISVNSTSAAARQIATTKAQVNDPTTGLPAASAAILQLNNVTATSGSAAARTVYNVYSRLEGSTNGGISMEQQFQTQASVNSGLYGQYSLKIDADGYVAGMGLSVYPSSANGAYTSSFIIKADNFAFGLPGQTTKYPFIAGVVNGQQTVGINGALVIDGTLVVRQANIQDLAVSTLKIGDEAVTLNRYTEGYGGAQVFAGQVTGVIGTIVVTVPENVATKYTILFNWSVSPGGPADTGIKCDVNGWQFISLSHSCIPGYTTSHSASSGITLGPGTYTFSLRFYNQHSNSYFNLLNWSMTIIAAKR